MSSVVSTYKNISAILSFKTSNEFILSQADRIDWDAMVVTASRHLVLPALYSRLKTRGLLHILPLELEVYLNELSEINKNRNIALLKQIQEISDLFKAHKISHLFLKGAAFLIKGSACDGLERMVGDIDVLVPSEQLHEAFRLLEQHGYSQNIGFNNEVKNYRHLNRQISKNHLAAVELHDALIRHPKQHLVNAKSMLDTLVYCNNLPIPNDYFMGLHGVMAFQVNDFGYYYKHISLKTLYDTVVLKVPEQIQLINTLQSTKYGRLFLTWACILSDDYKHLQQSAWQRLNANYLQLKSQWPIYSKLIYALKSLLQYFWHRLQLWVSNPSYRLHVLKNKFKKPQN
jgi:hypothetical protein